CDVTNNTNVINSSIETRFYAKTCPNVATIVRSVIQGAMQSDPTITAALLRQPYHDCFVNGCDASNLLDNSDTITSEKDSPLMKNARGFEVIDKSSPPLRLHVQSGGPSWNVTLGRRDSLTASQAKANTDLPASFSNFSTLASKFFNKGLNLTDLVALSGGHTIGHSPCSTIKSRLYNSLLKELQKLCPRNGDTNPVTDLDPRSPTRFDNSYFKNLQTNEGLLITDQNLWSSPGCPTIDLVKKFSDNQSLFFDHFVYSMNKMININPLTGSNGEIRLNCRKVNKAY
ncbi:Peroxidase 15, partial [Bienertia sinuspersici]